MTSTHSLPMQVHAFEAAAVAATQQLYNALRAGSGSTAAPRLHSAAPAGRSGGASTMARQAAKRAQLQQVVLAAVGKLSEQRLHLEQLKEQLKEAQSHVSDTQASAAASQTSLDQLKGARAAAKLAVQRQQEAEQRADAAEERAAAAEQKAVHLRAVLVGQRVDSKGLEQRYEEVSQHAESLHAQVAQLTQQLLQHGAVGASTAAAPEPTQLPGEATSELPPASPSASRRIAETAGGSASKATGSMQAAALVVAPASPSSPATTSPKQPQAPGSASSRASCQQSLVLSAASKAAASAATSAALPSRTGTARTIPLQPASSSKAAPSDASAINKTHALAYLATTSSKTSSGAPPVQSHPASATSPGQLVRAAGVNHACQPQPQQSGGAVHSKKAKAQHGKKHRSGAAQQG